MLQNRLSFHFWHIEGRNLFLSTFYTANTCHTWHRFGKFKIVLCTMIFMRIAFDTLCWFPTNFHEMYKIKIATGTIRTEHTRYGKLCFPTAFNLYEPVVSCRTKLSTNSSCKSKVNNGKGVRHGSAKLLSPYGARWMNYKEKKTNNFLRK